MQHAADAADAESDEYEREQAGYLAQIGDSAQQVWIVAQIQQRPECRAAAENVLRAEGLDSLEVFAFGAFQGPRPSVRVRLPADAVPGKGDLGRVMDPTLIPTPTLTPRAVFGRGGRRHRSRRNVELRAVRREAAQHRAHKGWGYAPDLTRADAVLSAHGKDVVRWSAAGRLAE